MVNFPFADMKPDQIILHEIAVVIVGKTHNPSILNPDFLRHNGIVPEEMKPADGPADVVSTPLGARIAYESGLTIVGDPQRIVFTESVFGKSRKDIVCPDAAKSYLRAVPHVRYAAVGVNPEGHLDVSGGERTPLPGALLQDGARREFQGVKPSAEVELTYPMKGETVTVHVAVANVDAPVNIKGAVVFRGNFHRVIGAGPDSLQEAVAAAGEWENDLDNFRRLAKQIAGEMT